MQDGTKFTTPALKSLSAERLALDRSYQQQQRHLVEKVVDVASSFCDVLFQAGAVLAELDVLAGFADLAACAPAPYVRPTLRARGDGEARIVLEGSRHPCVEVQDGVNFVPNDCRMERGSSWFHVITGPNMGGKSTFIRQARVRKDIEIDTRHRRHSLLLFAPPHAFSHPALCFTSRERSRRISSGMCAQRLTDAARYRSSPRRLACAS